MINSRPKPPPLNHSKTFEPKERKVRRRVKTRSNTAVEPERCPYFWAHASWGRRVFHLTDDLLTCRRTAAHWAIHKCGLVSKPNNRKRRNLQKKLFCTWCLTETKNALFFVFRFLYFCFKTLYTAINMEFRFLINSYANIFATLSFKLLHYTKPCFIDILSLLVFFRRLRKNAVRVPSRIFFPLLLRANCYSKNKCYATGRERSIDRDNLVIWNLLNVKYNFGVFFNLQVFILVRSQSFDFKTNTYN